MVHVYHPNKSIKGFACSFWYSQRDDSIYARLVKQSGWDAKNDNGTFKESLNDPERNVTIKLSAIEAGAILDCIERSRPFSSFHQHEEKPKSIKFEPWMADDKQKGYSFSVSVSKTQDSTYKNSFYIGLTFAEGRIIREALIYFIHTQFDNFSAARPKEPAAKPTRVTPPEPVKDSNNSSPKQSIDPLVDF